MGYYYYTSNTSMPVALTHAQNKCVLHTWVVRLYSSLCNVHVMYSFI